MSAQKPLTKRLVANKETADDGSKSEDGTSDGTLPVESNTLQEKVH